jgi:hypothetical protein
MAVTLLAPRNTLNHTNDMATDVDKVTHMPSRPYLQHTSNVCQVVQPGTCREDRMQLMHDDARYVPSSKQICHMFAAVSSHASSMQHKHAMCCALRGTPAK